jgi:periplasmic protein TonB
MSSIKPSKKKWLKYVPAVLGATVFIAAIGVALLLKQFLHKDNVQQKKMVQQVTILTPPPPPPPKEEIKPPEVEEEIPEELPEEPVPEQGPDPSPGEELGVDADGAAGGDGFGLVAKRGGRGLLGAGGYELFVRQELNELFSEDAQLNHQAYVAVVTLWIDEGGNFTRIQVEQREGAPEVEKLLQAALEKKRKLSRPRPLEAADRITLRLKSVL